MTGASEISAAPIFSKAYRKAPCGQSLASVRSNRTSAPNPCLLVLLPDHQRHRNRQDLACRLLEVSCAIYDQSSVGS
jgi:hypothetical protein